METLVHATEGELSGGATGRQMGEPRSWDYSPLSPLVPELPLASLLSSAALSPFSAPMSPFFSLLSDLPLSVRRIR